MQSVNCPVHEDVLLEIHTRAKVLRWSERSISNYDFHVYPATLPLFGLPPLMSFQDPPDGDYGLPDGFQTIQQIQNLSNAELKKVTLVNLIGFTKDYQTPVKTSRGKWAEFVLFSIS